METRTLLSPPAAITFDPSADEETAKAEGAAESGVHDCENAGHVPPNPQSTARATGNDRTRNFLFDLIFMGQIDFSCHFRGYHSFTRLGKPFFNAKNGFIRARRQGGTGRWPVALPAAKRLAQ
ncbi:MAG: hypothetical protein ABSH48_17150 [Verrucomicrobiota bacterium]